MNFFLLKCNLNNKLKTNSLSKNLNYDFYT